MGQAGSSVACTSIEEQDYLLTVPQRVAAAQHLHHPGGSHLLQALLERERLEWGAEAEAAAMAAAVSPAPDSFTDLSAFIPDECLECILAKLSARDRLHCSLVCRRWHKLEGNSRTHLSLVAKADLLPSLPRILGRFVELTKITLKCDRREPSVDDRALLLIAKHCSNLLKIKLKGCRDVTDEGLNHLSRKLVLLRRFSCAACGFGPKGLNFLLQRCLELESIAIKRLRGLSSGLSEMIGPGHGGIRKLCLKELRNARLFGPLILGSPNLQQLRLSKNFGQWDKVLEAIMEQRLPLSLTELHMERLHLTDRGLQAVAQCRNLEELHIVKASEITNFGLSAIAFGCSRLKRLRLDGSRSSRIGDEGLISIAKRCRELQEMVLIRIGSLGVGSLSLLGSNCSKLERMAICNCESFGDVELSCVAARFGCLRKLCIRACPISNLGVEGLASGCPALSRLKIRNCSDVSAQAIGNLKLRIGRSLWISLINDIPHLQAPDADAAASAAADQEEIMLNSSNNTNSSSSSGRIHRVGTQMMRSKMNWANGAAVSCYCVKSW